MASKSSDSRIFPDKKLRQSAVTAIASRTRAIAHTHSPHPFTPTCHYYPNPKTRLRYTSTSFGLLAGSHHGQPRRAALPDLFHRYGVPKHRLPRKMFGVFEHDVLAPNEGLLREFDCRFMAPHSRHTETRRADLEHVSEVQILSESTEAGVYMAGTRDGRHIFITGHSEYDPLTLKTEYDRDIAKGLPIDLPRNYYPNNDPSKTPIVLWRAHANLLYSNWLNYYVYQVTSLGAS